MIIGIDASRSVVSLVTGVEYYSRKIIQALTDISSTQHEHKIIFYTPVKLALKKCPIVSPDTSIRDFFQQTKNSIAQRIIPRKHLWTQIGLSRQLFKDRPDVLFIPSHVLPRFLPKVIKPVMTIHDLAFAYLKSAYSFSSVRYLHWTTQYGSKRAHKIIVPSQATSDDLVKVTDVPKDKIVIIPHGAPEKVHFQETYSEAELQNFGLEQNDPFILYIGRLEEKKNLTRAVRVFSKFAAQYNKWKLILAGQPGVGFPKIIKTVMESSYRERILFPGYINSDQKAVLFQNAKVLLLPSLYEGFGFPILEAFQYSVPVLAANSSAIPEVAGDAAYLFDPFDEEAFAQGMEQVCLREDLRQKLIEAGKERIRKFSWKRIAQKTWDVLTNS